MSKKKLILTMLDMILFVYSISLWLRTEQHFGYVGFFCILLIGIDIFNLKEEKKVNKHKILYKICLMLIITILFSL